VAAAALLVRTGRMAIPGTVRLATDVGVITVDATEEGGVTMTQMLPEYGAVTDADEAAATLGLDPDEILRLPQVVSTGSPFLFVPIRARTTLDALHPDPQRLTAFLNALPGRPLGVYIWTRETVNRRTPIHARCFAPGVGLPEDPVTGSASGALGAYLLRHSLARADAHGVLAFSTEQGRALGRPGQAQVRLKVKGSQVTRVQVGGEAVLVAEGRIWV
jgi:trans-2,3-dihydro-3-hydroxyanthranilate isomerase